MNHLQSNSQRTKRYLRPSRHQLSAYTLRFDLIQEKEGTKFRFV
ncbi:unnamed protein product [Clonostachys rosea f. rosea IK726]|uniref:Uncharacterized protein n=1 Tax=Clonostachys rosea f. rosea IK726 TaxID=1349383 RepID=A0ACA9TMI2_BIOOC|nr:unnamed protein product [Clonostachys rosea f. rosea IK726]